MPGPGRHLLPCMCLGQSGVLPSVDRFLIEVNLYAIWRLRLCFCMGVKAQIPGCCHCWQYSYDLVIMVKEHAQSFTAAEVYRKRPFSFQHAPEAPLSGHYQPFSVSIGILSRYQHLESHSGNPGKNIESQLRRSETLGLFNNTLLKVMNTNFIVPGFAYHHGSQWLINHSVNNQHQMEICLAQPHPSVVKTWDVRVHSHFGGASALGVLLVCFLCLDPM